MSGKRLLSSWINMILCLVNFILWILEKPPVGTMLFNTFCPNNQGGKFLYGLCSLVQWAISCTLIGTIITIIFWATDKDSIAVRLYKILK